MSDPAVAVLDAPRRLDAIDRKILTVLQDDASLSVAEIGDRVGLSSTPCWKRIQRMEAEGVDLEVNTSWKRERLNWATGVSLIVPLEVRNEDELAQVASLARQLLLGQTTLQNEFPDFRYGKADWLKEQEVAK